MQASPVRSRITLRDSFSLRIFVRYGFLVVYPRPLSSAVSILFVAVGISVPCLAAARSQSPPGRKSSAHGSANTPVAAELARRIAAAQAARASGEPDGIA